MHQPNLQRLPQGSRHTTYCPPFVHSAAAAAAAAAAVAVN